MGDVDGDFSEKFPETNHLSFPGLFRPLFIIPFSPFLFPFLGSSLSLLSLFFSPFFLFLDFVIILILHISIFFYHYYFVSVFNSSILFFLLSVLILISPFSRLPSPVSLSFFSPSSLSLLTSFPSLIYAFSVNFPLYLLISRNSNFFFIHFYQTPSLLLAIFDFTSVSFLICLNFVFIHLISVSFPSYLSFLIPFLSLSSFIRPYFVSLFHFFFHFLPLFFRLISTSILH